MIFGHFSPPHVNQKLMFFDGPKSKFSPLKISCLMMDPLFGQNLMSNSGPLDQTAYVIPEILGPFNDMSILGLPIIQMSELKAHVY